MPIDATIALELADTGSDGVDRASAHVWVDGVLAFDGSAMPELAPAFAGPLEPCHGPRARARAA